MHKFNIIIPTLNSYKVLKNCVLSIKIQSYSNWKVIFVDGKSNKKHKDYLKAICKEDERFVYMKQKIYRKGIFGAMNQGIEIIDKKSWVFFLGSDDWLLDKFTLEKINKKIKKNYCIAKDFIVFRGLYFDINKNIYSRKAYFINAPKKTFFNNKEYKKLIFNGYTPPHQVTLFNSNSKFFNNIYNDNFKIAGDLEFFCRICQYKSLHIAMSTGGISNRKHLERFTEVFKCYWQNFKILFFMPFSNRYFNRIRDIL